MKLPPSLLFVLALLFVGCGEPDPNDPDKLNKILEEALDADKIQERGKEGETLFYAPNDQKSYTGWVKEMHDNGQVRVIAQVKDGKPHGRRTSWYEDGQKEEEGEFVAGKLDGVWTTWHENGQKKTTLSFVNGKPNGIATEWYENGQKEREIQFENGKEVAGSVKRWLENGERIEALDEAVNNLKQMFILLFEYDQEEGKYPDDLEVLQTEGYTTSLKEISNCMINGKKAKFAYRPGFNTASSSAVILLHTPKPIAGKMVYLKNDGSVRTVSAEQFEKLINALK